MPNRFLWIGLSALPGVLAWVMLPVALMNVRGNWVFLLGVISVTVLPVALLLGLIASVILLRREKGFWISVVVNLTGAACLLILFLDATKPRYLGPGPL